MGEWRWKSKTEQLNAEVFRLKPDEDSDLMQLTVPALDETGPLPWSFTPKNKTENLEVVTKRDLEIYKSNQALTSKMPDRLSLALCARKLRVGSDIDRSYVSRVFRKDKFKTCDDWWAFFNGLRKFITFIERNL